MGFLSKLGAALNSTANAVARDVERKSSDFNSGYNSGSSRASNMSDDELRSSLKRAHDNGISGWDNAGKVRAMADEYKRRQNK